jgi:hypothetical protein
VVRSRQQDIARVGNIAYKLRNLPNCAVKVSASHLPLFA